MQQIIKWVEVGVIILGAIFGTAFIAANVAVKRMEEHLHKKSGE